MTDLQKCHPEVADAIHAIHHLPRGPEQVRAAEDALALAQRIGGFPDELAARMELTTASYYVPRKEADLTHFVWLRRALDDPRLDDEDRRGIIWKLKWAIDLMMSLPSVPMVTIRAAIDDVESVLLRYGWQLRPIHAARAEVAHMTGDLSALAHHLTLWRTTPRDAMTDCEACELRGQAQVLRESDPVRAIETMHDVTQGRFTCAEEPARTLGLTALLSVEIGDPERAIEAHHQGWRLCRDDAKLATAVANHLVTLTRLGNVERALDHLVPRIGWIARLHTATEMLAFKASAALVLRVACAEGHAPEQVAGRDTHELADDLAEEAKTLARRLDDRNGSDLWTAHVRRLLDARLVSSTPTLPPLRVANAGGAPEQDESIPAIGRLLEAQFAAYDVRVAQTVDRWMSVRSRLLPRAEPTDWTHVAKLDRIASRGRPVDEARRLLSSAAESAFRAGDTVARLRAEAELALLPDGDGRQDVATADRIAQELHDEGHLAEAARTWLHSAQMSHEDAGRFTRRAVECLQAGDDEIALALARLELAQHEHGDDPAGARQLLELVERSTAADVPIVVVARNELRAALAWSAQDQDGVMASLRAAVAASGPATAATRPRLVLCDLLVDDEQWAELEGVARGLLDEALLLRRPELLALAQRFLGLALVESGRPVEAAELLEAALPVIRETEPRLTGPLAWALGNALSALGEHDNARTAFATAAMGFEADDRLSEAAHAHLRAGNAAWGHDPSAAEVHLDAAVEFASRIADPPVFAQAVRDRASLRAEQGDTATALTEIDGLVERVVAMAARADQSLPDDYVAWLGVAILRQGAHLLERNGDTAQAELRLAKAVAESSHDPRFRSICRAEQGAMLARQGRLAEAESLVREGVAGLHPVGDRGIRAETVGSLAQAVHDSGDTERADRIWEELVVSVAE